MLGLHFVSQGAFISAGGSVTKVAARHRRSRSRVPLVVFSGVAMLAAGCASDHVADVTTVEAEILSLARQAKASGFDSQYEALQDGEVSESEYRQSKVDMAECFERMGLEVGPIASSPSLEGYVLVVPYEYGGFGEAEAFSVADQCQNSLDIHVEEAWTLQTAGIVRPEVRLLLVECLAERLVDARDAKTVADFQDISKNEPGLFGECANDVLSSL